jgi:hypothetical protein
MKKKIGLHRPFANLSFFVSPTTELEVGNIIKIFKDNSAGWDDRRPGIIKIVKEYITNPLTHICHLSFSTGVFPFIRVEML